MRYSKEHKFQTHSRIVKRASVKLREKGAHGIGVADLMKDAGLTHGGFYAHFDSREALVIEAFTHAMDRSTEHWRKQSDGVSAEKRLATIVNTYLSPLHRDNPGQGCAVPALAAEITRESARTRRAFAGRMQQMIDMLARQFHGMPPGTARKHATAALATMMGSLVMARIAGTSELSDEILKSGREAILERAKPSPSGKKLARKAGASA